MPWLELCLVVRADQQPAIEVALDELGALAVTLRDANAETPDEQAIFEPGVGELPLWPRMALSALFAADADRPGLLAALAASAAQIDPAQCSFRIIDDQDWERAWMDQYQPMRFGTRLWIFPWNIDPPPDTDAEAVVVRLDPGLAFGSGTHPTTALCLRWLDALELDGKCIIDYGCGSGVLAIAALKLGAGRAICIDNDPQALLATRDNARRNGVDARLATCLPDAAPASRADVFVANILAGPLATLAPRFAASCQPGAPFAISGILDGQQGELLACYAAWFNDLAIARDDGWIRISGRRAAGAGRAAATPSR